jgi:hypothetical protein
MAPVIRFTFGLVLVCAGASAQLLVQKDRLPEGLRDFVPAEGESKLKCEVRRIKPALNFGFRFQSGYVVRVPMEQFEGSGHRWSTMMRVTPAGGEAVYLMAPQRLPNIPETDVQLEFAGGFLVGEGKYRVDWLLVDDQNRVCRDSWDIQAERSRSERNLPLGMPPGVIDDIGLRSSRSRVEAAHSTGGGVEEQRITVLLHAAPLWPGRVRLRSYDRVLLLSSLSALIERLPAASFRVVAFNLDQQQEIFRSGNLNRRAFAELAGKLEAIELGTVDVNVLNAQKGHLDLLTTLVKEELEASPRSDIVIVLGPSARQHDKVPKSMLEQMRATEPRFFYFQYKPNRFRGSEFPDTISHAIKRIGGKVSVVRTPADFGKAILEATQELGRPLSSTPAVAGAMLR